MKDTWRKSGLIASSIAVVVILIIVAFLEGGIFGVSGVDSKNAGSGTVAFHPGFDKIPTEAACTDNHYIDSSTRVIQTGNMEYRQFATAISIHFKGTTDVAVTKEITTEICGNPTVLRMVLDDMMLWSGFPGAEENKAWIVKILNYIAKHSLDAFSGTNEAGNKIVNPRYQKYAGWVNTVQLRSNAEGKQSLASTRNWELPATSTPGIQPVAVQATVPENKPAWVRTLRDKVGTCLYRYGFNAEDKRIETFPCAVPTPPTYTPPCKKDCGPTTSPICKTNCSPTPPCTVKCSPPPLVCPPNLPDGNPAKGCKDTPAQAPNYSDGNGTSYSPTPTTPSPTPTQPPSTPLVNPPTPTTPIIPAPVVTPQPSNPTAPPVDTSSQSGNGYTPPTGTGGACNPEFQSC